MFASVVFIIRLFQGIVIGAAQGSGIAQITLLALLEIIFLCALNIWRPYHRRTSMNGWHTFMSCVRLLIILFLIAFIPSFIRRRRSPWMDRLHSPRSPCCCAHFRIRHQRSSNDCGNQCTKGRHKRRFSSSGKENLD